MTFQPASLIGFALVFFAASWIASLVVGIGWRSVERRVRELGPQAERTAASIALVMPVVFGAALMVPLLAHATAWRGRRDHCLRTGDGLHFCFQHGVGWLQSILAVGILIALLVPLLRRSVIALAARRAAKRHLTTLHTLSSELEGEDGVRLVRADQRFCFVAGPTRATIYVSRAAWEALSPEERSAVLAHERAHVAQGDVRRRGGLALLACLGVPALGRRLLAVWEQATERLCDLRAAAACGDPAAVASAMLILAGGGVALPGTAFIETVDEIDDRVRSVLRGGATGEDAAREFWQTSVRGTVAVLLASLVFYDQIHTALEHCLRWRP